jgi:ABC-type branched-subunit amino acid transport system substrate-binding protein
MQEAAVVTSGAVAAAAVLPGAGPAAQDLNQKVKKRTRGRAAVVVSEALASANAATAAAAATPAAASVESAPKKRKRAPAAAKLSTIDSEVIHDFLMHALKVGLSRV